MNDAPCLTGSARRRHRRRRRRRAGTRQYWARHWSHITVLHRPTRPCLETVNSCGPTVFRLMLIVHDEHRYCASGHRLAHFTKSKDASVQNRLLLLPVHCTLIAATKCSRVHIHIHTHTPARPYRRGYRTHRSLTYESVNPATAAIDTNRYIRRRL
jgi:hypothetical protein